MSQLYVPGPAQVFVGTGGGKSYQFLGYTEAGVDIVIHGNMQPVFSDVGGPLTPVDMQWMADTADFTIRLTHHNQVVLTNYALARLFGGTPGSVGANQNGTLMITEGFAMPMAIVSPYAIKTVFSSTMIPGFVFGATFATDPIVVPISVRTEIPQFQVTAIPVWNTTALSNILYSTILPSLPSPS